MTIAAQKQKLRDVMKHNRAYLNPSERERATQRISENLASLQVGPCVAVYLAKGNEANVDLFIRTLKTREAIIAAPVVEENQPPRFARFEDFRKLRSGAFGLKMPRENAAPIEFEQIDTLLLPGLAFDKRGVRLGYGSGWYDKVSALPSVGTRNLKPHCVLIGVCYDLQLVYDVPREEHDARMNIVVTPTQIIYV